MGGLLVDLRDAFLDIARRLRVDFLGMNTPALSPSSSSSIEVPLGVKEVRRGERDFGLDRRGRITVGVGSEG